MKITEQYTIEELKRGVRNPFFEKLNKKTEVAVRHEDYKIFAEIAEKNGTRPEVIMNRCLASYAKKLKEHGD